MDGTVHCTIGWVDVGTRTKGKLRYVAYYGKHGKNKKKI
jgi:hypothetical protein